MGLYFNNQCVLVHLGNKLYELNIGSPMTPVTPVEPTNVDRLLSKDLFVLCDSNGVYLVPKTISDIPPVV
jgi:hypothetical protein